MNTLLFIKRGFLANFILKLSQTFFLTAIHHKLTGVFLMLSVYLIIVKKMLIEFFRICFR